VILNAAPLANVRVPFASTNATLALSKAILPAASVPPKKEVVKLTVPVASAPMVVSPNVNEAVDLDDAFASGTSAVTIARVAADVISTLTPTFPDAPSLHHQPEDLERYQTLLLVKLGNPAIRREVVDLGMSWFVRFG